MAHAFVLPRFKKAEAGKAIAPWAAVFSRHTP